ncbi:hypothetical protein [Sphaerisporangium perillae]|uniref:hypothetical protein n=1 Tax=Sphaerisporangium perillae TaxID=2935860 RepID=UPI002010A725|nr:hypothetical protein [Sphaerisporangium perillae]
MHLTVVTVGTPGWLVAADPLRSALQSSVTAADHLEHAYLDVVRHQVVFALFLRVTDQRSALGLAEQLCRRTMATVIPSGEWTVVSVRIG